MSESFGQRNYKIYLAFWLLTTVVPSCLVFFYKIKFISQCFDYLIVNKLGSGSTSHNFASKSLNLGWAQTAMDRYRYHRSILPIDCYYRFVFVPCKKWMTFLPVEELEHEAFQIIAPMEFVVNAAIFLGSESINKSVVCRLF